MEIPHFVSGKFSKEEFVKALDESGFAVVEDVINNEFCAAMIPELERAIEKEAAMQPEKNHKDYGMLLACPIYGGSFTQLAGNRQLMAPFEWVLGEGCIIYVYTSSSLPPHKTNYAARIHVDRPHFIPGYTEALGCLVMLNDFSEQNGATYVLPGSHLLKKKPSEDFFYKNAVRITAPRGSVFYFNLRLYHAAGNNTTNHWRHSVGIGMIRGYLKQRIDLPRAMEYYKTDLGGLSDFTLQKLGFFSQPPFTIEQYYMPAEKRTYRQTSEWDSVSDND